MSKDILTTISIFIIAILVVILGFFLLDIEKVALNYWAFASLLFSLVVSPISMLMLVGPKRDKDVIFYTAGLSSTIWIYQVGVAISILFTQELVDNLGSFIFLQIVINALFFVSMVIIIATSRHIHDRNISTYEKLQNGEYDKPKRGGFNSGK